MSNGRGKTIFDTGNYKIERLVVEDGDSWWNAKFKVVLMYLKRPVPCGPSPIQVSYSVMQRIRETDGLDARIRAEVFVRERDLWLLAKKELRRQPRTKKGSWKLQTAKVFKNEELRHVAHRMTFSIVERPTCKSKFYGPGNVVLSKYTRYKLKTLTGKSICSGVHACKLHFPQNW